MKTFIPNIMDNPELSDDLEKRVDQAVAAFMNEVEDLLASEQNHKTTAFDFTQEDSHLRLVS